MIRIKNLPSQSVRILKSGFGVIQNATMTGRSTRGHPLCLPKPFPYKDKSFQIYHDIFDNTSVKVNQENAKLIVVEGPIAVGKSAFCKVLAEEFDLHFIPQPTMDEFYLLPSGYDLRQHDGELPERVRSYDHKNFCLDPRNMKAARFQLSMMYLRFFQYLDGICHLLNTGQGVVLERSYFSDYVFLKAMVEQKYVSKEVAKAYRTILQNSSTFFIKPHMIIYLDIPVPVVQERIRTRNYSYEQNSPALTKEYLESLEKFWKQDFLKKARKNSEILIYDWTDGGEIDVIIDDIEKIDFDIMRRDLRFKEWWISRSNLFQMRYMFTNYPYYYSRYFDYPFHKIDDLYVSHADNLEQNKLLHRIPECRYDKGYNPLMGDSFLKILLSSKLEDHRNLRHHLKYTDFYVDDD